MRDNDKHRTNEVISFDDMAHRAQEEGVSSAEKMALIITTDMGYTHCYRNEALQQYLLSNDAELDQQPDIERMR